MRGSSFFKAAVFAGAGLMWQTASPAQQVPSYAAQEHYLPNQPGEICPPLNAPSPYATPPVPLITGPGPMQPAPPTPPPSLNDFPQNQGMYPPQTPGMYGEAGLYEAQPILQQPYAPSMAADTFLSAANSPQSIAPNMIGDFFGTTGMSSLTIAPSTFTLPAQTFNFADIYRDPLTGAPVSFPASMSSSLPGFIDLTAPSSLVLIGDATSSIPQGTVWTSAGPIAGPPPSYFFLQENPVETGATQNAFPDATSVNFVEGVAEQNPSDPFAYSIYSNYLVSVPARQVTPQPVTIVVPDPGAAPGAFIGRQKISENSSPLPRTRVFLNYSYFNNTPLLSRGLDVSRVTPGLEWAFLDENVSLEVRAPFASTLSSDLVAGGLTNTSEIEFGNLTAFLKALVWESDTLSASAGVGMTFPTADDVTYGFSDGRKVLRVENESIHLLPFLGFLYTPRERLFMQGFFQVDVDTNGNPVEVSSFSLGGPTGDLRRVGRAEDSTYVFVDFGIGYWMYRNRSGGSLINGLAPIVELHYNAASEGTDTIRSTGGGSTVQFGRPGDLEVTNVVLGLNAIVGDCGTLTIGYAAPVAGDDQFDDELRITFNWFLGPQTASNSRRLIQF